MQLVLRLKLLLMEGLMLQIVLRLQELLELCADNVWLLSWLLGKDMNVRSSTWTSLSSDETRFHIHTQTESTFQQ